MNKPLKFVKKPTEIEAIKWTGENAEAVAVFLGSNGGMTGDAKQTLWIETLDSIAYALPGDWIIKGIAAEFYPCKPDIFDKTYQFAGANTDQVRYEGLFGTGLNIPHA